MSAADEIVSGLDLEQLATELGTDPGTAEEAVRVALPTLFDGMQANLSADPQGAAGLVEALTEHADDLTTGGIDLADVDTADGEKIVQHLFANSPDQLQALQASSAGGGMLGGLMGKLLPILAPIVLSYIAKRLGMGGSSSRSSQSSGGGGLGDLLGPILGGLLGGGSGGMGGLGDILGGGSQQQPQQYPQYPQGQQGGSNTDILGQILGQILAGGSGAFPQVQDQGSSPFGQDSSPFGQGSSPSVQQDSGSSGPFQSYPGAGANTGEPRVDMSDTEQADQQSQRQQGGGTLGDILGQIFGR